MFFLFFDWSLSSSAKNMTYDNYGKNIYSWTGQLADTFLLLFRFFRIHSDWENLWEEH